MRLLGLIHIGPSFQDNGRNHRSTRSRILSPQEKINVAELVNVAAFH
jgi:hypothetical protein